MKLTRQSTQRQPRENSECTLVSSRSAAEWKKVAHHVLVSRALDDFEETKLAPEKRVTYQFSARGHDVAQVLLGTLLTHPRDAVCGYYRSRPMLLSIGVPVIEALRSSLGLPGGYSNGRDIGVVSNFPNSSGTTALPICGGVGSQYTPAAGWAHALKYHERQLKCSDGKGAISVALGGDGSVAANGFWSALNIATTLKLPMLFFVEDNGFGISVSSSMQTPGGNIAENLASFQNLRVRAGDGADPTEAERLISESVEYVRRGEGPCLLRLKVPRLQGHSFQDTQSYKSEKTISDEWRQDPLPRLESALVPRILSQGEWAELAASAVTCVEAAWASLESSSDVEFEPLEKFVFSDDEPQRMGGLRGSHCFAEPSEVPKSDGQRINMVSAIRRTLDHELSVNPKMIVYGQDVGIKGGVHAATLGLQEKFGSERVFDTSLSEEGIIGRAVGMAIAGLLPVPEIQFRKYADSAAEQINDCGTLRWRTCNRFAAPMVVRIPVGFFRCGDPWHSQTNEVQFVHSPGWKVAVPSNAQDAVGLLRTALRGDDPTIFLEHRSMLDAAWARRPYPGDDYALPFGKARIATVGKDISVITWGAMVERCEQAAAESGFSAEVVDLRTLMPWDQETVLNSVAKTGRCLVVHEDLKTGGFGSEICAAIAEAAFLSLDAPISRITMPDVPSPYSPSLLASAIPDVGEIRSKIDQLCSY